MQKAENLMPGEDWVQTWLNLQCKMIAGINQGVVALGQADRGPFLPAARWPESASDSSALSAAAEAAIKQRQSVFRRPDGQALAACVACPLLVNEQLVGVVAIELEQCPDSQQQSALQLLQWGTAWLEVLVRQQAQATNHRLVTVVELVTACVEQATFKGAATAVATELARLLQCERVSIGFPKSRNMQVLALSNSARFDKQTNLIRHIGAAMDEAADQGCVVLYPAANENRSTVNRALVQLAEQGKTGSILTVPLYREEKIIGAMVLEREPSQHFDQATVSLCEYLGALIGPVLEMKRQADRGLLQKARDAMRAVLTSVFGSGHLMLKTVLGCVLALSALLYFLVGDFRVSATATLEGSVQRVVVAPMDGYIATARVRAGDLVKRGDELAVLDDKDLRLQRLKLSGEQAQLRKEYRGAMAGHDRAETSILNARLAQTRAQLELVQAQLERTRLVAPYDGIVVTGDLSQSLGAPVERGEVLFEVAPLADYRVILQVDERDIGYLKPNQTGHLALSGSPDQIMELTVSRVTPVSTNEEGRNFFRVEAHLEQVPAFLRPGMEGIGKIEIEERRMLWIWTHRMTEWLRLWQWSWWPWAG